MKIHQPIFSLLIDRIHVLLDIILQGCQLGKGILTHGGNFLPYKGLELLKGIPLLLTCRLHGRLVQPMVLVLQLLHAVLVLLGKQRHLADVLLGHFLHLTKGLLSLAGPLLQICLHRGQPVLKALLKIGDFLLNQGLDALQLAPGITVKAGNILLYRGPDALQLILGIVLKTGDPLLYRGLDALQPGLGIVLSPGYIVLKLTPHLGNKAFHVLLQAVCILTGTFLQLRQHLSLLVLNGV